MLFLSVATIHCCRTPLPTHASIARCTQTVTSVYVRYVPVSYKNSSTYRHSFCRAMLCISATIAIMLCPSVHLSVTFADHVKTNKHSFDFFFTVGHSSFSIPNGVAIFRQRRRIQVGYRDSGLIAGYRRLLDVRSAKNSYQRPCSVDRTVGDSPANVCL